MFPHKNLTVPQYFLLILSLSKIMKGIKIEWDGGRENKVDAHIGEKEREREDTTEEWFCHYPSLLASISTASLHLPGLQIQIHIAPRDTRETWYNPSQMGPVVDHTYTEKSYPNDISGKPDIIWWGEGRIVSGLTFLFWFLLCHITLWGWIAGINTWVILSKKTMEEGRMRKRRLFGWI